MAEWENIGEQHPVLKPWMDNGLEWATNYIIQMDDTEAYVVSMFLNSSMCFSWIKSQWDEGYIGRAKATILKTYLSLAFAINPRSLVLRSTGYGP
ncbi:hypothetical protein EDB84DRAFT_1558913 [Lactarius hengduanensis]|nr:hypothetical protein EDB84DRAFT_1558913 [Lactarius hengduanensis]